MCDGCQRVKADTKDKLDYYTHWRYPNGSVWISLLDCLAPRKDMILYGLLRIDWPKWLISFRTRLLIRYLNWQSYIWLGLCLYMVYQRRSFWIEDHSLPPDFGKVFMRIWIRSWILVWPTILRLTDWPKGLIKYWKICWELVPFSIVVVGQESTLCWVLI
jgi:hypothetical protein